MQEEKANAYQDQILLDKFYMKNGKCCAGCDHWRHINCLVGECTNSKILPSHERTSLLNVKFASCDADAGHAFTRREYLCGQFKDDFDWKSLPMMYLKQIGFKNRKKVD